MAEICTWLADQGYALTNANAFGDVTLFQEYRAFIQMAFDDVVDKFSWVNEPPYSFAGCDDQHTAMKFLMDAVAEDEGQWHRATRRLMEDFQEELEETAAGNFAGLSNEAYTAEIRHWRALPLTSDRAEGYHRSTAAVEHHSRNARKVFVLASTRLDQNLDQLDALACQGAAGEARVRRGYINYSTVLRTSHFRQRGMRRLRRAYVFARVYRLGKWSQADWASLVGGDDGGGGPGPHGGHGAGLTLGEAEKLFRDYIRRAMVPNTFYTVADRTGATKAFHFLRLIMQHQKTPWTVRLPQKQPFIFVVQELEVWATDGETMQVYATGAATREKPEAFGDVSDYLSRLKSWRAGPSETEGCMDLNAGTLVAPDLDIDDPVAPILWLAKLLQSAGWEPANVELVHDRHSAQRYSTKKLSTKRGYFACLLLIDKVWACGLRYLHSNQIGSYYRCILEGKPVPPRLADVDYKAILEGTMEVPVEVVDVGVAAAGPELDGPAEGSSDGEQVLQPLDDITVFIPLLNPQRRGQAGGSGVGAQPLPLVAGLEASSDSDILEAADAPVAAPPSPPANPLAMPTSGNDLTLDGLTFKAAVAFTHPAVTLKCPHHRRCKKVRQTGPAQTARLGAFEPIAYLATWCAKGRDLGPHDNHVTARECVPTEDEQRAWLAGHGLLDAPVEDDAV